jgi:diacylglycerol/phytol O-acyltransferase
MSTLRAAARVPEQRFERPGGEAPARPRPLLKLHRGLHDQGDHSDLGQRDPWFMEQVVRVVERVIRPYHRGEVAGLERVPEGAALYVGNHSGGSMTIDSFLFGAALFRARGLADCPRVLAHDLALRLPGLRQVFVKLGAVRACPENARRLFEAGHKVLVYPGGDEEAMRPFRDRNRIRFFGHRGYVRTALRHDVPIVPVVGQGSHATFIVLDDAKWLTRLTGIDRLLRVKSWPLTFSLPWGFTPGPPVLYLPLPAKIRMEILEPIRFARTGAEAAKDEAYVAECARLVEGRMQETLSRLARA